MYGLSYKQLKTRTIISFVTSAILLIVMIIMNANSKQGLEVGFLIFAPIVIIIWTLEVLGMLVCWRELWKPYCVTVLDAFKSLVCLGAGTPVVGFFGNFFKSFGILLKACFKSLIISIKVIIFVLGNKNEN